MIVERNEYLTAGVHIGMKTCTPYMKQFVYKVRDDGLAVFNLKMVDERVKTCADFLSQYKKILIVSRKEAASKAIQMFADSVNGRAIPARFPPGTLTNPSFKDFYEPDIVFVVDPLVDEQAIKEAKKKRIPIVAFCDTFNSPRDIDYIIPLNNNGKKSLALVLWILAREVLKNRKEIKKDKDFRWAVSDFEGSEKVEKVEKIAEPKRTARREVRKRR